MRCPNCQHPNSETAKFCENCGYNLRSAVPPPAAPPSAAPLQDAALGRLEKLVPKEFATRLLNSRSGRIEGERRVVTILFCDVKGSTALGADRDPEEILEIMNGAFELLIEPVYRYEGTLARLMGDAVLAFFGAPIAHEDDPERACLAALAMQERIANYAVELERTRGITNFSVRVGINTGLVVVGEVGSDLRVEYTAMGDAINLASRLENAAAPGTILISENTARRVQHALELAPVGPLQLKGKSEPVPAFRVLERKTTATSARGIAGLVSPLVGRERELAALREVLASLEQGSGRIVSLIGEAGLGKSRLLAELRAASRDLTPPLRWLEGRSLSYETSTPFAPWMGLLGQLFELAPGDTDLDQYDQVANRIETLMPGRSADVAPFIATLLGIELIGDPLDRVRYLAPPVLRAQIMTHILDLLGVVAQARPAVLVFEDLHWADASSLELLGALAAAVPHAPLVLLSLFRPNRNEPAWQFHELAANRFPASYLAFELQPLDEAQARTLVANLLEIEDLPESVRALILAKAEGNPFYVEEVIRSLLDQKLVVRTNSHWRATRAISNIAIPDTLSGVISARLDRLDEDARHTAQTAAVVGREFEFDVLSEVSDLPQVLPPALDTLQARELVRLRPQVAHPAYLFKHALTQETAYGTLLKSKRVILHKRVGECLERVAPDKIADIARHFLEAGESGRALPYLIAVGDRAARAYSSAEAIPAFTQAVEIARAGTNNGLARRAYEGLAGALSFTPDVARAVQVYQEMYDQGVARDDIPMQVSALNKLSSIVGLRFGQFPEAEARLSQAEALARRVQDHAGLAELFIIRCQMCSVAADFDGAVNYMGQAVAAGRAVGIQEQMALGLAHIASTQIFMTRLDEAYKTAQEGLALTREIGDREHFAEAQEALGEYYLLRGDLNAARDNLAECVATATQIGVPYVVITGSWALAWVAAARGEYAEAFAALKHSLAAAEPAADFMPFMLTFPVAALAALHSDVGSPPAQIAEYAERAVELLQTPLGQPGAANGFADLGDGALARGDFERAQEYYDRALNVPSIMKLVLTPRAFCGLAQVALARGELETAQAHLAAADAFATERSMKFYYPFIALGEGQLALASGHLAEARVAFARTESLAAEMGLRPLVARARTDAADALDQLGQTAEAAALRAAAQELNEGLAARRAEAARAQIPVELAEATI